MLTKRDARIIATELKQQIGSSFGTEEVYMTIEEAADFLCLSKQTLYNKGNEIPRYKRGKRIYYKKSSLQRYIEGQ